MRYLTRIFVLVVLCGLTSAFGQQEQTNIPSAMFRTDGGFPGPNLNLPPQVPAPLGKLTFFADFAAKDAKGVPLYLVNRTSGPISFVAQDREVVVSLEHQMPDGQWERAQVHNMSDCGNSYYPIMLHPGQHIRFYGYMPASGEKTRVRFANNALASNEADGFVLAADIQACQTNSYGWDAPYSIADALDLQELDQFHKMVSVERQIAAFRLLQAYGGNLYYKQCGAALAQRWETNASPTPDEATGAKVIRELLSAPWPLQSDPEALLRRCIKALQPPGHDQTNFAMPEQDQPLVWEVLSQLAESEFHEVTTYSRITEHDPRQWKPVMDLVQTALQLNNVGEYGAIARIMDTAALVDELLPSSFFETHLFSDKALVQQACVNALARRLQWKALVELGWKLPPATQLMVLAALAKPPEIGTADSERPTEEEGKFWKHCIEAMPLEVARALYPGPVAGFNNYFRVVREPLHTYLLTEAERGAKMKDDFDLGEEGYNAQIAVELLANMDVTVDIPVFKKLLKHRGYQVEQVSRDDPKHPNMTKHYTVQKFVVRAAARLALLKRGVSVPDTVVLEKDVTH